MSRYVCIRFTLKRERNCTSSTKPAEHSFSLSFSLDTSFSFFGIHCRSNIFSRRATSNRASSLLPFRTSNLDSACRYTIVSIRRRSGRRVT